MDKTPSIDYLKCPKCSPENHEGIFCRCEARNIRIAKEQRFARKDLWKNVKIVEKKDG